MGFIRSIRRILLFCNLNLILWGKTRIQAEFILIRHGIKEYRFLGDDEFYSLELQEDRLNILYGALTGRVKRVWFG